MGERVSTAVENGKKCGHHDSDICSIGAIKMKLAHRDSKNCDKGGVMAK